MSTTQSQRIRELKLEVERLKRRIEDLETMREKETPVQWLATELSISPTDLQSMLIEGGLRLTQDEA